MGKSGKCAQTIFRWHNEASASDASSFGKIDITRMETKKSMYLILNTLENDENFELQI